MTMKIYFILLNVSDPKKYEAVSYFPINGKFLYGVTNSKKLLKLFTEMRDMNKFEILKCDIEDEDEYNAFIDKNDINVYELTTSSFPTTTEYNGYYLVGYTKVVCTIKESDEVEYDYDSYILDKVENIMTNIYDIMRDDKAINTDKDFVMKYINKFESLFNKEIREALDYLDFKDFIEDAIYQMDNLDSSEYNFGEDKLSVFCKKFGNTFKEGPRK